MIYIWLLSCRQRCNSDAILNHFKSSGPLFEAVFPALLGDERREAGQGVFAGSEVLILGCGELAGN